MFELTKNKNKRKKIDPLALVSSEFLPQSSAQESKLKQLQKCHNKAMLTSSTYLLNKYSRLDTAGLFIDYSEFI